MDPLTDPDGSRRSGGREAVARVLALGAVAVVAAVILWTSVRDTSKNTANLLLYGREYLAAPLLLLLGTGVAIVVMLWAPKGIWGLIAERFGWQALPLQRYLVLEPKMEEPGAKP